MYALESAPSVDDFIHTSDDVPREALLVRTFGDEVELRLNLPRRAVLGERRSFDELCQVVEGVSHFLYVAERARRELPVTQLELELQAEVDKYVLLGLGTVVDGANQSRFEAGRAARVRERLFEQVSYLHSEDTEDGERYRVANHLAARYADKLEKHYAQQGKFALMRSVLRNFYVAGQTEKIALARAA